MGSTIVLVFTGENPYLRAGMIKHIATFFGTFFYAGFFPFAPATFASAVFIAIYAFIPYGEYLAHPIVALVTLIIAIPISTECEKHYGHDPGCVVIDEVVGMQVILMFAEPTLSGLFVAFVIFRVFDIWKPPPINKIQDLPGGWGIVLDDLMAGIYSRIAMVAASLTWIGLGRFQ